MGVLVALTIGALAALAPAAPASAASPDAEASFVAMMAQERLAAGLPGYTVAADLAAVARDQAAAMAAQNRVHHNPSLTVQVAGWDVVGENVGRGLSVLELHQAFMASDSHRREIMSPRFTEVGVGVVDGGGQLWVSEVFRLPRSAPAPAPARVAAAASAPAPAPVPARTPAPRPPAVARPAPTTTAAPTTAPPPTTPPTMVAEPVMALVPAPAPAGEPTASLASLGRPAMASAVLLPGRRVSTQVATLAAVFLLAVASGTARTALAPARARRPGDRRPPGRWR